MSDHPLADKIRGVWETLDNRRRLTQEVRDAVLLELVGLMEDVASIERGYDILSSTVAQQKEALKRTETLASAHQHRADLLTHELNEAIAHVDASAARMRQTRSRISGLTYETPPYPQ